MDTYAAALEAARRELASKKTDLLRLEAEVLRLQRTVSALSALVDQPKLDVKSGLTEAVKTALQMVSPAGQYPTTVRLKLEEAGFSFADMANPMASVHSILKRLEAQGFARTSQIDGKAAYFWEADAPPKPRRRGRGRIKRDVEHLAGDTFGGEDGS
ncbi:MAG TPA: hypothetical protein VNJ02_20320 [Vicinamibacterales bacterium]|nr:hypothetical protein [Vicinamibacterales bacterium]